MNIQTINAAKAMAIKYFPFDPWRQYAFAMKLLSDFHKKTKNKALKNETFH